MALTDKLTNIADAIREKTGSTRTMNLEGMAAAVTNIKIPTALSDLNEDETHRTVTDAEKKTWNDKSDFSGNYDDLKNKPTIPTIPEKLPNPYALTFTGAVDKVYDGSQEITIEIPSGESKDDWNIIADETLTEDVIEVVYNGLSLRKILICIYAIGSAANTTNGNSIISINGNSIFYSPNITVVGDTTTRWAQFFADCIKDTIRFYASTNNNNTYQSTQIMTGWFDGVSKIETVKIHSNGLARMIGAGTRIRILGVTAS